MPRYYCDYCDNYLTHDSPSVRKQHNAGFKHKANVRAYYLQFEQQETEDMLEKKMAANMALAMRPGFIGTPAVLPTGTPPLPRAGLVRPPMSGGMGPHPNAMCAPVNGMLPGQGPPPGMGMPPPGTGMPPPGTGMPPPGMGMPHAARPGHMPG